jgi:kynurenine formamidase
VEEHLGTHADAPSHVAIDEEGGRPVETIDTVPLEHFVGRPRIIDARLVRGDTNGESPWIRADILSDHEAKTSPIESGDVVLFWTGWTDEFYQRLPAGASYVEEPVAIRAPGWPAPHAETLRYLAERKVRLVGVDAPSLGALHDPLSPHRAALLGGITPIENLANLGRVSDGVGLFVFLPLSVLRGTGAPGRAVVLLHASAMPPDHADC